MQLFYNAKLNTKSTALTFSKDESRHVVKVLRKKVGDRIEITNGNSYLFLAEITDDNPKKCSVKIIKIQQKKVFRDYRLIIGIAPTKSNDRLEWFLEKATEIGVDEIYLLRCDNSERKHVNPERLQKVVLSAMKQSLQFSLPILHEIIPFEAFIRKEFKVQKYIAHCEETNKKSFQKVVKADKDICILIGPEGDFSTKEIELATKNKFIPVSLGRTRLRTETAGIVAVHTVSLLNERN